MKTTLVDKRGQVSRYIVESVQRYKNRASEEISESLRDYLEDSYDFDLKDKSNHILKIKNVRLPYMGYSYSQPHIPSLHVSNGKDLYEYGWKDNAYFFNPGDILELDPLMAAMMGSGAGNGGDSEDEYDSLVDVELSNEEFLKQVFQELELDNLYKKNTFKSNEFVRSRAGFVKQGLPCNRSLKKTMKQYISRVGDDAGEEPIISEDLRYYNFILKPKPTTSCVALFLMDVSGSVSHDDKRVSRNFFWLCYHLLKFNYENVEVRFFVHTTSLQEIEQKDFFTTRLSGGTDFEKPYKDLTNIVKSGYNLDEENVYLFQTGDGDAWELQKTMEKGGTFDRLLGLMNYFYYLELNMSEWAKNRDPSDFFMMLKDHDSYLRNIKCATLNEETDLVPTFRKIFTPTDKD